jgi:hypothetical protein
MTALAMKAFKDRFSRASVEKLSAEFGDTPWLKAKRLAGWDAFERMLASEERNSGTRWLKAADKFPDLALETGEKLAIPSELKPALDGEWGPQAGAMTYGCETTEAVLLDEEAKAAGVLFLPLREALKSHGPLLEKHLFSRTSVDETLYAALHAAYFGQGALVYIPKHVKLAKPLRLRGVHTGGQLHVLGDIDQRALAEIGRVQGRIQRLVHRGAAEEVLLQQGPVALEGLAQGQEEHPRRLGLLVQQHGLGRLAAVGHGARLRAPLAVQCGLKLGGDGQLLSRLQRQVGELVGRLQPARAAVALLARQHPLEGVPPGQALGLQPGRVAELRRELLDRGPAEAVLEGFHRKSGHPMPPSISSSIRRLSSTAYSSGSSLVKGSMKPLTIISRASSPEMPRLVK